MLADLDGFLAAAIICVVAVFLFIAYRAERQKRIVFQNTLSLTPTTDEDLEKEIRQLNEDLNYYKKRVQEEHDRAERYKRVIEDHRIPPIEWINIG